MGAFAVHTGKQGGGVRLPSRHPGGDVRPVGRRGFALASLVRKIVVAANGCRMAFGLRHDEAGKSGRIAAFEL